MAPRVLSLLASLLALGPSVSAQAGVRRFLPPRRLMAVGDSITQGGNGFASWRYPLWAALPAEPALELVGRRSWVFPTNEPGNPDTSLYPEYYDEFDRDHEAWWGARTDQLERALFRGAELGRPDVVLVHLGTNDVGQWGADGIANVHVHLPLCLEEVRAARPATTFLLAQVIPIGQGNGFFENGSLVPLLNEEIAAVAAAESTIPSPVVLVDQFTGFDLETDMQPGGLHPNVSGENRMAGVWLASRNSPDAFTADRLPVRLRRRALSVRLRLTSGAHGSSTDFDNVRLQVR